MKIIGHKRIIEFLSQNIQNKTLSHAYLFTGPPHIGKTTLSKIFSQVLQCEEILKNLSKSKSIKFFPCNKCQNCQQILSNSHPDTIFLEGINPVGIEEIRNLQHQISLKNFSTANYKISVIENIERLTLESANCFLKTLEEPPSNTILILTTSFSELVLPTIVSRCQIINLNLVPFKEIKEGLTKEGIDEKFAETVSGIVAGRPGLALEIIKNPEALKNQLNLSRKITSLLKGNLTDRMEFVKKIVEFSDKNNIEIERILDFWIGILRDALLICGNCSHLVVNQTLKWELENYIQDYDILYLKDFIEKAFMARQKLKTNTNQKLLLESLVLSM